MRLDVDVKKGFHLIHLGGNVFRAASAAEFVGCFQQQVAQGWSDEGWENAAKARGCDALTSSAPWDRTGSFTLTLQKLHKTAEKLNSHQDSFLLDVPLHTFVH